MRAHITHYDDCGCLSETKNAEIARLTRERDGMAKALSTALESEQAATHDYHERGWEIARLTRELADLKSEMRDDEVLNDEVCRQFDKMKAENAALREVVEAVKWHIVWEDSVYGIASGSVSRTWQAVLDALAALDAEKEEK